MNHVDKELLKEVRKANGNGSRADKFALLKKLRDCRGELENKKAFNYFTRETFDSIFKKYDRAVVAILLAATIYQRQDRLERSSLRWAIQILSEWTARPGSGVETITIHDGLHPTRIEEYAGSFIRLTTCED